MHVLYYSDYVCRELWKSSDEMAKIEEQKMYKIREIKDENKKR